MSTFLAFAQLFLFNKTGENLIRCHCRHLTLLLHIGIYDFVVGFEIPHVSPSGVLPSPSFHHSFHHSY